ncbi:MAG: TfoX/Sxy family protein [Gallionella sp.]
MASARNEFVEYVVELMTGWASVSARKMFGGYGLYHEGLMFALIAEDQLFFKTDADNESQFERAGSHPFVYTSKTRIVQMSYWSAPEAGLESAAEICDWCQSAYGAALRANAVKASKLGKVKRK